MQYTRFRLRFRAFSQGKEIENNPIQAGILHPMKMELENLTAHTRNCDYKAALHSLLKYADHMNDLSDLLHMTVENATCNSITVLDLEDFNESPEVALIGFQNTPEWVPKRRPLVRKRVESLIQTVDRFVDTACNQPRFHWVWRDFTGCKQALEDLIKAHSIRDRVNRSELSEVKPTLFEDYPPLDLTNSK